MNLRHLMIASTILAGAPATFAHAQGQTPVGGRLAEVGELVVTAQKRDERLLDVPVQVTAVAADALTKQNLVRVQDFYTRVPGLQYSGTRVTGLSIRGINSGGVANPTVAILVDDVQFGGSTGSGQPSIPDFDPATLDHIEVLRGPQGTLYGAASLGGLIKYVTKQPSTNDFSARVEAGGQTVEGGDTGYALRGSTNLPLFNDKVGVLLSGFMRDDPRWMDNINTGPKALGNDVNKRKVYGGRGALLIKATDDLSVTLTAMKQWTKVEGTTTTQICAACQVSTAANRNTAVTTYDPLYGDIHTLDTTFSPGRSRFQLFSGRIDYDMGWANLTSVTAWNKAFNTLDSDVTSVFRGLLLPPVPNALPGGASISIGNTQTTKKYSQEFRLSSPAGHKLEWLGGLFWTGEESEVPQTLTVYDAAGASLGVPYVGAGPQKYREIAGFGTATYHFNDKFDLQVGARYAKNAQSSITSLVLSGAGLVFGPAGVVAGASEENAFTWVVTPTYRFSPNAMAYARVASGYRPGGPNTGIIGVNATFDSDSVINYEVGFKGYLIPSILSIDVAAFLIDWKDIQLSNTDAVTQLIYVTNGGKARSRGLEAALTWRPMSGLTIEGNTAFTQAELSQNLPTGPNSLFGRSGDRLPFTPKQTFSASIEKTFVIDDDITAFVGASYAYIGNRLSAFKTDAVAASRPRFTLPSYTTVDLRAGAEVRNDFEVTLFVRNLFDKDGVITAGNRNGTGVPEAVFTQPRTAGVTLTKSF